MTPSPAVAPGCGCAGSRIEAEKDFSTIQSVIYLTVINISRHIVACVPPITLALGLSECIFWKNEMPCRLGPKFSLFEDFEVKIQFTSTLFYIMYDVRIKFGYSF